MCRLTVAVIIKSANQQQHLLYQQHALQRDYLILITNCIKTVAWSICRPKKKSCCYTREFFCSDMLTARHLRSMQKFQDQNKTEVFISHSSVDLAFSRAIATDLMDAGFSVFLDDWSINIGERIFEKISTGLCESKALIMIISKDYLKSVCCTDEWGAFYGKALHDKSCVIYPIIIDDSAPPALISQIKYLRFNGDEYASALSTLLRSLRKQFSK